MQESMHHKLVVEVSSSVIENSDQADALTAMSIRFRANVCHKEIRGQDVDEPLVIFVNAMHLQQQFQREKTKSDENEMTGAYSSLSFFPILIGIPLPFHILQQLDEPCTKLNDDADDVAFYDEILPQIHPSLVQLRVCGVFRSMQRYTPASHYSGCDLTNVIDLMVLTTRSNLPIEDGKETAMAALSTLIEEVNGEAFECVPSCAIQIVTISNIEMMSTTPLNNNATPKPSISKASEIPMCPVCRYRIEPQRFGLPPPKETQRCSHMHENHCGNWQFLAPWSFPTYCEACQLLQKRLQLSGAQPFYTQSSDSCRITENNKSSEIMANRLKCFQCNMEETLWVCLTCGIAGCGRYSSGHAEQHYNETGHAFSLELATQRIWDYETGSFVHRDDLLNCPFIQKMLGAVNRAAYHSAAICSDNCVENRRVVEFEPNVKKTIMIGEEYEVLLQSALEDQAQHFEGEIAHLQADLAADAVNKNNLSTIHTVEIERLERETSRIRVSIESLSRQLIEVQAKEAGHRAKANALLREQGDMNQLLEKIRDEAASEQKAGKEKIEELEQQVSDLTANLRMRQQFTQNRELNEAQIYGTGQQKSGGRRKGRFRSSRK